jgi:hypothetical protein
LYTLLLPQFSDLDSALWHGQVTQYLSRSTLASASDPTGQDSNLPQPQAAQDCFVSECSNLGPNGGDGGGNGGSHSGATKRTLLIAVLCGVIGGVLLVVVMLLWLRHKRAVRRATYDSQARMRGALPQPHDHRNSEHEVAINEREA